MYQFVLKETPNGKADHDHHLGSDNRYGVKGVVIGVIRQGDVVERYVGDSWLLTVGRGRP